MESSIAEFLMWRPACELSPTRQWAERPVREKRNSPCDRDPVLPHGRSAARQMRGASGMRLLRGSIIQLTGRAWACARPWLAGAESYTGREQALRVR